MVTKSGKKGRMSSIFSRSHSCRNSMARRMSFWSWTTWRAENTPAQPCHQWWEHHTHPAMTPPSRDITHHPAIVTTQLCHQPASCVTNQPAVTPPSHDTTQPWHHPAMTPPSHDTTQPWHHPAVSPMVGTPHPPSRDTTQPWHHSAVTPPSHVPNGGNTTPTQPFVCVCVCWYWLWSFTVCRNYI